MSDRTATVTTTSDDTPRAQITTQSKFMQQYRVASPLEMTRSDRSNPYAFASSPHGTTGDVHVFTIGAGGKIWDVYPNSESATGFHIVDTGLIGNTIAAQTIPDGVRIWAAIGNKLSARVFRTEWAPAQPVTVPATLTGKISRILVDTRRLPSTSIPSVAVVATRQGGDGTDYEIYGSIARPPSMGWVRYAPDITFDARTVTFYWGPDSNGTHPRIIVSNSGVFPGQARIWDFATFGTPTAWGEAAFPYQSLENIANPVTPDELFALSIAGNLCLYEPEFVNFKPVTQRRKYVSAQFTYDADNRLHAFLHTEPGDDSAGDLFHTVQDLTNRQAFVTPTMIYPNVASFTVPRNADGDVEVFLVDDDSGHLLHMFGGSDLSPWQTQTIEIPNTVTDNVEEYISYSTDISITDAVGAPLIDTQVSLSATEQAALNVNGVTMFVNPHRNVSVRTNSAGVLSVTQETDSLGVPSLKLHIPDLMQPDEVCTIEQYADGTRSVESRLDGITRDDLKNARDADGQFLLKASFRDSSENLDALSSSFQSLMKLPDRDKQRAGTLHPMLSRQGPRRGVHIGTEEESLDRLRVTERDDLPNWSLTFEGDGATYRSLTPDEAQARIAEIEAQLAAGGLTEWLGSLGDFIQGVADGFVSGITWIMHGARRLVTFVVDQITYVFDRVIQFVQEAFEMVEAILVAAVESVAQFFEKTFEWLGFLFDWPDILRTRDALSYVIEQGFQFLKDGTPGLKRVIDNRFGLFQTQAGDWFDNAIRSVGGDGTTSLGRFGSENTHHDDDMASALGNNVVMNGLITKQTGITSRRPMQAAIDLDGPDDLFQMMTTYTTTIESDPRFTTTTQYFESVAGGTDQFFDQPLMTLLEQLKALALLAISGTRAMLDLVLDRMRALLDTIEQAIRQPIDIPFLSELYATISGGHAMTTLDLIALLGAVPTTIFYKLLVDDEAPFPDEQSITDFKAEFSAASLLQSSGLGSASVRGSVATGLGAVSKTTAVRVEIASATMTAIFGDLTAILDLIGNTFSEEIWYKALSLGALVLELTLQLTNCPWITEVGLPCDPVQDSDMTRGLWIAEWSGFALDLVFYGAFQCLPENVNTKGWNAIGVSLAWVYGMSDCFLRGYAISRAATTNDGLANFLPTLPGLFKVLLYHRIVESWRYAPVIVAAADVVAFNASAVLAVLNTRAALQAEREALVAAP